MEKIDFVFRFHFYFARAQIVFHGVHEKCYCCFTGFTLNVVNNGKCPTDAEIKWVNEIKNKKIKKHKETYERRLKHISMEFKHNIWLLFVFTLTNTFDGVFSFSVSFICSTFYRKCFFCFFFFRSLLSIYQTNIKRN